MLLSPLWRGHRSQQHEQDKGKKPLASFEAAQSNFLNSFEVDKPLLLFLSSLKGGGKETMANRSHAISDQALCNLLIETSQNSSTDNMCVVSLSNSGHTLIVNSQKMAMQRKAKSAPCLPTLFTTSSATSGRFLRDAELFRRLRR